MYPVNLHIHTIASTHAYSTLHDHIAKVKCKGIKLFTITDHGLDMADAPYYWHFVNTRIWPRLVDGVGILCDTESNIKNIEGEIDRSGSTLTSLDLIIARFHEPVFPPQDRDTYTQAMIAAMISGKVHMISHPDNPKFPVDIPAIAEAAACYQMALEINNSSFISSCVSSEDNCRAIVAAARDAGGWVALGPDSRTASILGEFTECRKIFDVVGSPEKRALNVSLRRLLNFLGSWGMPAIPKPVDL